MFKILVVEDDREMNKTVCSFLIKNGYEAVGCLSANVAYDAMYCGTLFDLIISDIMMPGADGFEFAKTVRKLNQQIPILFMTARDDFASKHRGFKIGIKDYMVRRTALADCGSVTKGENRHQQKADSGQPDFGRRRTHRLFA